MRSWNFSLAEQARAADAGAHFVLYFGGRQRLRDIGTWHALRTRFPKATILGCSSGGEISHHGLEDGTVSGLALEFEATRVRLASVRASPGTDSYACGVALAGQLAAPDLAGIILLCDGLDVNGDELAAGLASILPRGVTVSGGMAADGESFAETLVSANAPPAKGIVAAAGFYGSRIRLNTGSAGGWTVFGPRRIISKSVKNLLHDLDGHPAIELYEKYLDEEAGQLPGSGLRFPLLIRDPGNSAKELIRTLLAVDRANGTMTFAGNLPEGWTAQLMRSNADRLSEGAEKAAWQAIGAGSPPVEASVLVSCIGRRMLMGQRTEDEIEAVASALGRTVPMTGFYAYGEFSTPARSGPVELHNQTMTVLTLTEAPA